MDFNTNPENLPGTEELHRPRLRVVSIHELLETNFPTRELLLAPWLRKQSLDMLYAWRGIGKTFVALEIAYSVATGGKFLKWQAPKPHGVLYVDGEMPGVALQERVSRIVSSENLEPGPDMFRVLTPDLQEDPMPDLATTTGQRRIEDEIGPATDLIVIDNLSSLVRRAGRENDAESWLSLQEWALGLRSQGKSVLFVHHSGKGGGQRGTSKREDVLDNVIALRRPPSYDPLQGCVFEVHFEKARGLSGPDIEPVQAKMTTFPDGTRKWEHHESEESIDGVIKEMIGLGMPRKEIIRELKESHGKSQPTAYRLTEPFFRKPSP